MDTWLWADAFKSGAIGDLGLAGLALGGAILVGTATYVGGCWVYVKTRKPEQPAQPASIEIEP